MRSESGLRDRLWPSKLTNILATFHTLVKHSAPSTPASTTQPLWTHEFLWVKQEKAGASESSLTNSRRSDWHNQR